LPKEKVKKCSILDQTVGAAMKDFKVWNIVIYLINKPLGPLLA
jgi:hypothetical protein